MSQLLQFYKSFQHSKAPVTKSAPTFEDLTIDDKLTEQQRVVRYVKSSIGLQRLVHVKMMADVAKSIGYEETVKTIIPLIEPLSRDVESVVKQHLVEQLRHLAKFCRVSGGAEGYRVVLEKILPITAQLLEDEKAEVRQSASMTLVEVAQIVDMEDIGQYVLTIILRLAHEDDKEEMRMTASQLLNLLAECLGHDLCKQFVIPEVVSLSEDPVFRVRKSTALNFHNICKVGGEFELLERLMPAFVRLSKDDMYRVRRACAESLAEIAKNVSEDIRLGVLVEIFLRLTHDPSKLVKQSVLQQSGVFIAALPPKAVSETILNQYCSMVFAPTGDMSVDNELRHICAYSFPAVLQVIGPERWSEVREVYHNLAQSRSANIKQTLAYSLHEIARILDGGALVEEELVPVFEDMIQDVEAVQMGVIKYLAKFLSMLPEPCRVSYLPLLHDILHSTNPFNWRLRQHLARQLPELVQLPPRAETYRTLFPTVMILLQDPVAYVRRDTFRGVTALVNNLRDSAQQEAAKGEEDIDADLLNLYVQNIEDVVRAINSFAVGEKYQLRQLWLELCCQLLRDLPRTFFEENFIEGVLALTIDPVTNVRVAVSQFLADWDGDFLPPWLNDADAALPSATLSSLSMTRKSGDQNSCGIGISSSSSSLADAVAAGEAKAATAPTSTAAEEETEAVVTTSLATLSAIAVATAVEEEQRVLTKGPWHWLLRRTDIRCCMERLANDDPDICLNLTKIQPLYPDLVFTSISCRGRKTPPGGIMPVALNPQPFLEEQADAEDTGFRAGYSLNYTSGSALSALMETASQVSSLVGGHDDDACSMALPEEQLHFRNVDSNSSIASSGSSAGVRSRSSSNPAVRTLLASAFSSEADSISLGSTASLPRTRSRNGSITAPEIHLEAAVDISPVEIEKMSKAPTPPSGIGSGIGGSTSTDLDFSAALSAAVAAVGSSGGTHKATILPTDGAVHQHIVTDELELFEGFAPAVGDGLHLEDTHMSSTARGADHFMKKSFDYDDDDDDDVDDGKVPYKDPLSEAEMQEMLSDSSGSNGSDHGSGKQKPRSAAISAAVNADAEKAPVDDTAVAADATVDAADVDVQINEPVAMVDDSTAASDTAETS